MTELGAELESEIFGITGLPSGSPRLLDWLGKHGVDWDQWTGPRTATGAPSLARGGVHLLLDFPLDEIGLRVATALVRQRSSLSEAA